MKNEKIKMKAYAKINLYLAVLRKREDGYHDLLSLMHNISLFDVLEFEEGKEYFKCNAPLKWNESNILYKALRIFEEQSGIYPKVGIKLQKRIPMKGGLGGASTDAAALLRYLCERYTKECDILELAKSVGSDVPFFLYGGCALVEGRGDIITPLNALDLQIGFYFPSIGFSTPEMYAALDELGVLGKKGNPVKLYEALKMADVESARANLYNSFEEVVRRKYPYLIEEMKRKLNDYDLLSMSGSGSTFYGLNLLPKTKEGFSLIDRPLEIFR